MKDIETNSVKIEWESEAENFEILYGISGFDISVEGTNILVNDEDDYELEDLSSNTSYDIYIRTICTIENKSDWTEKLSFTTKENLSIEDFDKNEIKVYPNPANDFIYVKSNRKNRKNRISKFTWESSFY